MNTNKITIIGSIIAIILIISIPTIYKIVKNHNNHLYEVVEKNVISSAKKCYYEGKCKDEKTTLQELYDLKYLEPISNPVTKEYYNASSYITRNNNIFKFVVVE